jgi:hypothetical protein
MANTLQLAINGRHDLCFDLQKTKSDPLTSKFVTEKLEQACSEHKIHIVSDTNLKKLAKKAYADFMKQKRREERQAVKDITGNGEDKRQKEDNHEWNNPKAEPEPIESFDEWQRELGGHYYKKLKGITESCFGTGLWSALELVLSVVRILNIRDITLPFMVTLMGKPSSSKTLAIELLRPISHTFYTDSFTPKSFVSHYSGVPEDQLKKNDLLPKIKNKIFLTPELAPTFSAREEVLTEVLGVVTRLMDGHGLESDSGVCGHRAYRGQFMFVWIGAVVEIPRKVFKLLSALGPKIYFYRLPPSEKSDEEYLSQLKRNDFEERKAKVNQALSEYLTWFNRCPRLESISDNMQTPEDKKNAAYPPKKIRWNSSDNDEVLNIIIRFAKLLGPLRGSVPTWETKETQGLEYAFTMAMIEEPDRAITQLSNLARGHALSQGRTFVTCQDLPIVAKTVLSTAPMERVAIFQLLLDHKGTLTTTDIVNGLNTSPPTAKRTMAELKALGLVDLKQPNAVNEELQITLKDEFRWFLEEEFTRIMKSWPPVAAERKTTGYRPSKRSRGLSEVDEQQLAEKITAFFGETVYGVKNSFGKITSDIAERKSTPYMDGNFTNKFVAEDEESIKKNVQDTTLEPEESRSPYEAWKAACMADLKEFGKVPLSERLPPPKGLPPPEIPEPPAFKVPCPLCDFEASNRVPDAAIYAVAVRHGFAEHPGHKVGEMLREMGYVTPNSVNNGGRSDDDGKNDVVGGGGSQRPPEEQEGGQQS